MALERPPFEPFDDEDADELASAEPEVWTASAALEDGSEGAMSGDQQSMLPPMAMGLAGILLGGMALFLNFTGTGQQDVTRGAVLEAANKISEVEGLLESLEERLAALEARQTTLEGQIAGVAGDTQSAFEQFGREVKRNRDDLARYSASLVDLAAAVNRSASANVNVSRPSAAASPERSAASTAPLEPAATPPASGARAASSAEAAASGGQRTHIIESGDSFWVLARRYNVSVDAIQLANPGVNPARLRVGQELKIPPSDSD